MSAARQETNATLEECSDTMRIGVKGPRATEWLQQRGCDVPALPNSWRPIREEPGSVIARLGSSEFFLEQSQPATFISGIASALSVPIEGVYPVLREDRAFVLSGEAADDVLAQLCNVDFKRVPRSDRQVVMTMMIGIAVLVIPHDGYRIWCDPSYGDYLWSSMQDVMRGA